jgi:hypothetical protein
MNEAAAWPAPIITIGAANYLAAQATIVFAFNIGHFEHGIFDIVDFAGFSQPFRCHEYMTGGTGKATTAFALDVGDVIGSRGFHQVQTVFDVS